MGRKAKPLITNVHIEKVAAEGKSIAYVDEKVLFVPNTVPGDVVDVQVTRKRTSFMEGVVTRFVELSPLRCAPLCDHFGICGGCKWQNLPYERQLEFKQSEVVENLTRIGKAELHDIRPIIGSEHTTEYRNKLEFAFCNRRYLTDEEIKSGEKIAPSPAAGFHIPGRFDRVLDIEKCHLQPSPSNEIRNFIKRYAIDNHLTLFNVREHVGLLRNLIIRTASTGEVMVILSLMSGDEEKRSALLDAIVAEFPTITSLIYVINDKFNDTIGDLETVVWYGRDHIFEEMEGLRFKIGPKSFYQTNSQQAYRLYSKVREFAGLEGNEVVYDLYTGTGTIALFLARNAQRVVGIEYVPEAIEDAKVNSALNNITNTKFYAGDMKNVLNDQFIKENGVPDVIITDPPRAGMHPDVVNTIIATAPKRIVYVSCNSATQARDLSLLKVAYNVVSVQPVDMFPHTHHVENILLLERR